MTLSHYAQPLTPGAMYGEGAQKLLGTPNITPHELVLRESAQNTWDARLPGKNPQFYLDVRRLSSEQTALLSEEFFRDKKRLDSHLKQLLNANSDFWVLEVADRKTSGLDGPINPLIAPDPGESTNFRNLVFAYGAARDTTLGGGTYGFGKTASFLASDVRTVVYWTKCKNGSQFEYRLIATAISDPYTEDGLSYTGRHWWGAQDDTAQILPLIGEEAQLLGERLFNYHFGERETGTNILILSPVHVKDEGAHAAEITLNEEMKHLAHGMRDSAVRNLWPKMTPDPDGIVPMDITISFEGEPLTLGDPYKGLWLYWTMCLNAARSGKQETDSSEGALNPAVNAIAYSRVPRKVDKTAKDLGTASFLRFLNPPIETDADAVFAELNQHVCLMRAPEIVVEYKEQPADLMTYEYCCGVFKASSIIAVDHAFATAENPTHTSWNTKSIDACYSLPVNRALNLIAKRYQEYLGRFRNDSQEVDGQMSATISKHLRSLVPSVCDAEPQTDSKRSKPKRARKKRISKPTITGAVIAESSVDYQVQHVTVETPPSDEPFACSLEIQRRADGGKYSMNYDLVRVDWYEEGQSAPFCNGNKAQLLGDAHYTLAVVAPPLYSLEMNLALEDQ